MTNRNEKRLPAELEEIGERLRSERPEASPLELDRMKTTALARVTRSASRQGKGAFMRSRLASVLVVFALLAGGTGAVMAASGGVPGSGGSSGSAPNNEYCPPSSNHPGSPKHEGGGNKCGHHHHHHHHH